MKQFNPQPGDFGLTRISGLTGRAVSLGQRLIGSGSYFTHAFVYVGNGEIVEAQPGGACRSPLPTDRRVVFSDFNLTGSQRANIVRAAVGYIGTPYSYLDSLEEFVGETHHMICSQLVAQCYADAGIPLFPGRVSGDVAPGDLARLIGA
ncbi:hypothetical protein PV343_01480 [Streptomyces sp. WI03-4A]|uniref:hypothetical protein n=1 Tax=Streptomyces sp. WI03-4A TaxID=3028706 RepID=UPI0029AECE77|nr:hypothetical protein [Streptomyces sp. WI03-4A]MDX2590995.1 hypothetical protein [Streptomyces sp. WI03-4A]